MLNTVEILAGDFERGGAHQALNGEFHLKTEGRGSREKVPFSDIVELEIANEESVKRLGGTIGWGLAGGAVLGPVGLLAGLIAGGKSQETVFVCKISGDRKFIARTKSKVFSEIQAGFLFKEDSKKLRNKAIKDQKNGLIGCSAFLVLVIAIAIMSQQFPGWLESFENPKNNYASDYSPGGTSSSINTSTEELLAKTRALPVSDFEGNLNGYRELARRDPANILFKDKVAFYEKMKNEAENENRPSGQSSSRKKPSNHLIPSTIISSWGEIGISVETPWKKSNFPNERYTYISQSRGYIGPAGPSGFETEITCELLGHNSSSVSQALVGVELWNPRVSKQATLLAIEAIKAIGVEVPAAVIEAFNHGQKYKDGAWEIVDESTDKLKEIRVSYKP